MRLTLTVAGAALALSACGEIGNSDFALGNINGNYKVSGTACSDGSKAVTLADWKAKAIDNAGASRDLKSLRQKQNDIDTMKARLTDVKIEVDQASYKRDLARADVADAEAEVTRAQKEFDDAKAAETAEIFTTHEQALQAKINRAKDLKRSANNIYELADETWTNRKNAQRDLEYQISSSSSDLTRMDSSLKANFSLYDNRALAERMIDETVSRVSRVIAEDLPLGSLYPNSLMGSATNMSDANMISSFPVVLNFYQEFVNKAQKTVTKVRNSLNVPLPKRLEVVKPSYANQGSSDMDDVRAIVEDIRWSTHFEISGNTLYTVVTDANSSCVQKFPADIRYVENEKNTITLSPTSGSLAQCSDDCDVLSKLRCDTFNANVKLENEEIHRAGLNDDEIAAKNNNRRQSYRLYQNPRKSGEYVWVRVTNYLYEPRKVAATKEMRTDFAADTQCSEGKEVGFTLRATK